MHNIDYLLHVRWLSHVCSFLLFLIIVLNYRHLLYERVKGGTGYFVLFCVMLFYSLFYVEDIGLGDLYNSMEKYYAYLSGIDVEYLHFEPIYFTIMDIVPWGYLYWRMIVWGSAALILLILIRRMNCDIKTISFFMCYYLLPRTFYYQRVSLAFAILLFGMYYYLEWKETKKTIIIILSFIFIGLCTIFHRSMPLYIIIMFISIYAPLNKKNWWIYIISIPVLSYFANHIGTALIQQSNELTEAGEGYLDASIQHAERNLNGLISEWLKWLPYTWIMLYALYDYIKRPQNFSLTEKSLLLFGSIMYIASLTLDGNTSDWFLGKMKVQSLFPMTIFLSMYFFKRKKIFACRLYLCTAIIFYMLLMSYNLFR